MRYIRLLPVAPTRDCPQRKERKRLPHSSKTNKKRLHTQCFVSSRCLVVLFTSRRKHTRRTCGGIFFYKAPGVCWPRPLSPSARSLLGGCSHGRAPRQQLRDEEAAEGGGPSGWDGGWVLIPPLRDITAHYSPKSCCYQT